MAAFKHMSVVTLAADLEAGTPLVVLDVRDPGSFAGGRVPGAVRLDNHSAAHIIATADKTVKTVVCCYHGHSSQGAAQFLAEQGFRDIYSLDGGVTMWAMSQPCETA